MTNYDDVSAKVDADEAMLRVAVSGDAELDHKHGQFRNPLDGLDSESLASFNLRRIRTDLGVSQQQIADRVSAHRLGGVKLSQSQIAKIERGERPWRLNELMLIAAALDVGWNEFFRVRPEDDHSRLDVEAARLRYEQAKSLEGDAREAWREAARKEYEAENEFLRLAARNGVRDAYVNFSLEMRWMHQDYVKDVEEMRAIDWETVEQRKEEAKNFAEQEWQRLVEEERRKDASEER